MTPKQKAIDIVEKYEKYLYDKNTLDEEWAKCVECAIIAVDEMIKVACDESDYDKSVTKAYLLEVKKEIEAL